LENESGLETNYHSAFPKNIFEVISFVTVIFRSDTSARPSSPRDEVLDQLNHLQAAVQLNLSHQPLLGRTLYFYLNHVFNSKKEK
jgi:hypothetical protein